MIFVTIGTTLPFDGLIKAVDDCVEAGFISDQVICQTGNGEYVPEHCSSFRFKPGIEDLIEEAALVLAHGGTGTVLDLIRKSKRFIVFANPLAADAHQARFLERLSREGNLIWSDDPTMLPELLKREQEQEVKPWSFPSLHDDLKRFLYA